MSTQSASRWTDWNYEPIPGTWDELLRPTGFPRTQWRRLATSIARLGPRELDRRWKNAQQLIRNNGITYNVYGDPRGAERLWPVDPIPLILSEEEWTPLAEAIAQRAEVLNAMLGDFYGPQRLLSEARLPPDLVFANPNYLRPCHGVSVPGDVRLHFYAADLARSNDGRWWVLNDRAQVPSGYGYALENRLVSAQTLSHVFSQCPVRPLTRFFEARREGLLSLAPGSKRMVLLTPGPFNETYFEHSYLAKFLGVPLVEGADLTVRGNRVFLKTLLGLEPVDLIMRRQDDAYCDPLELRGDSLLGVPGLLNCVRAGTVVVSNALGSGLVESPALMAFLPGVCQRLLGESLKLPSLATWWCGQEQERRYVLDHMNELVIKPSFPRFGLHPVFGADLDATARAQLTAQIEARPEQYVAQERVALSTAPVWTDEGLVPRHMILRVYAAWDGEGYTVMPGGLTRVSTSPNSLVVAMQQGGGSKDTWVLGAAGASEVHSRANVPAESAASVTRAAGDLPSRVADNLFWLGRYTERVEAILRLLRIVLPALSGEEDFGQAVSLETALQVLAGYQYLPETVLSSSLAEQRRQLESLLKSMMYDPAGLSGLGWNLKQIRRVAWPLKERLSADTWRVLQTLELDSTVPNHLSRRTAVISNQLDQAIVNLAAFAGLVGDSTTRGHGWRFLEIGRRLERGLQVIELLRHGLVDADPPALEMVLQVADSSITYRNRYFTVLRTDLVLDVLLTDETNPRSVGFQISSLVELISQLPQLNGEEGTENRLIERALTRLRTAMLDRTEPALDELSGLLLDVSEALTGKYLSHVMPSRLH